MKTKEKMVHCSTIVHKLDHRDKIQWYVYYSTINLDTLLRLLYFTNMCAGIS